MQRLSDCVRDNTLMESISEKYMYFQQIYVLRKVRLSFLVDYKSAKKLFENRK